MNLYLRREKQNSTKLVRISCVDISGSIDKKGLSKYINRSTLVLFRFVFFQCSNTLLLQHDILIVQ